MFNLDFKNVLEIEIWADFGPFGSTEKNNWTRDIGIS